MHVVRLRCPACRGRRLLLHVRRFVLGRRLAGGDRCLVGRILVAGDEINDAREENEADASDDEEDAGRADAARLLALQ